MKLENNLTIKAIGEPTYGGAHHTYEIVCESNALATISFQNGPVNAEGINGITMESLIAIMIHRLQSFQNGDFPCRDNARALINLEEALHHLDHRTHQRKTRGVEGNYLR